MDLVAACRAFLHVGERGSFTIGAAAARMSQSVASRRVAALEKHFGEQLFERTPRRATLTPFGRDMLPVARRLVLLADDLEHEAETAKRKPLRLAVPDTCSTAALARLVADARGHGISLELRVAPPAERTELVHSQEVRAALIAVPPDQASWSVPLGLAGTRDPGVARVYVETLRAGRADPSPPRRIWIQPEDDVPHIRDRMSRLCDAVGLRPVQLQVAYSLPAASAEVLCSSDVLLCSPSQATELGFHWRPIGEKSPVRGFAVAAGAAGDPDRLRTRLGGEIARCLGAGPADGSGTEGRGEH
ncbi:LysR family transcriptional regulator [Streptomyces sp. NPDC048639]|uniref:LysR family transcriptional regulator n=1 Tax=Streptomyces sp. NPDC048639 TaxID=3365581 RepID=UPI0037122C56